MLFACGHAEAQSDAGVGDEPAEPSDPADAGALAPGEAPDAGDPPSAGVPSPIPPSDAGVEADAGPPRTSRRRRASDGFAQAFQATSHASDEAADESNDHRRGGRGEDGEDDDEPEHARNEWGGFPAIAYNTYYGAILGGTASLTRLRPGSDPFHYRLQINAVASLRGSDTGVISPLQSFETRLDMPGLANGRLRIFALARYQRIGMSGYFGIGNAASPYVPVDYTGSRDRYFTYERDTVETRAFGRLRLVNRLDAVFGTSMRAVFPTPHPGGALARDIAIAQSQAEPTLRGYERNFIFDALVGLLYDDRDDEFNPRRGGMHELSLRVGGGPSEDHRLRYGSVYLNTRYFVPIVGEKLVLALRGIADVGFGRMPMLEMLSIGGFTNFTGPAGQEGNRGLPLGRQAGRVKLLVNAELRSTFYRFQVGSHRFGLGAVAFVDGSRVASSVYADAVLDGRGFDFLWSFGGGLRVLWNSSFVLRLDFGISPNAGIDRRPSNAFHFVAGHAF